VCSVSEHVCSVSEHMRSKGKYVFRWKILQNTHLLRLNTTILSATEHTCKRVVVVVVAVVVVAFVVVPYIFMY
jgi:hypothetical protein